MNLGCGRQPVRLRVSASRANKSRPAQCGAANCGATSGQVQSAMRSPPSRRRKQQLRCVRGWRIPWPDENSLTTTETREPRAQLTSSSKCHTGWGKHAPPNNNLLFNTHTLFFFQVTTSVPLLTWRISTCQSLVWSLSVTENQMGGNVEEKNKCPSATPLLVKMF